MWLVGHVRCERIQGDFVAQACALIAQVRPVLHQFSSIDETVPNAPKYEFRVQSVGLGAFFAKNSDATLLHELVH
jgi:hypothetical protein